MIQSFFDLAAMQSTSTRVVMVVLTVLLMAVLIGFVAALILPALDILDRGFRRTLGSWWLDRHARSMRRRMASVEKDMAAERKRLRAAAEIGRGR